MLENWIPGSCKGQQCRQLPALRGEVSDILLKDEKKTLFSPALSTISRGYGVRQDLGEHQIAELL